MTPAPSAKRSCDADRPLCSLCYQANRRCTKDRFRRVLSVRLSATLHWWDRAPRPLLLVPLSLTLHRTKHTFWHKVWVAEYFVGTNCCFQAEVKLEQIRSFLQQDLEILAQKIAAARQKGQSEESVRPLYDQAQYYAEKLRKFEQPAVTSHEGMLCPLRPVCL